MLVFIENTPLRYAWGSANALPEILGVAPTGEPQAELWLGAHPGSPAQVANANPVVHTLIDLIESDPERYGVDGAHLPFLLKILGIGQPLSLQVHPNLEQAARGFAAEDADGVPVDARERRYRDANHKPEMLVALGHGVNALCGFRRLRDVRRDLHALALVLSPGEGRDLLAAFAERLHGRGDAAGARRQALAWMFDADPDVSAVVWKTTVALAAASERAMGRIAEPERAGDEGAPVLDIDPERVSAIATIHQTHPGDAGILISMLLHLVRLEPGEALFLEPRQLHAYLGGIGVEVMAASDNVLRAGLTEKLVDIDELSRVMDADRLESPRIEGESSVRGLVVWQPPVPDFRLMRARVGESGERGLGGCAESISIEAPYPLVLVATAGRIRVERDSDTYQEVAGVRRGQSLYISAGEPIVLTGAGEAFLATVGDGWPDRNSSLSVS